MQHPKYETAKKAIDEIFADLSVSQEETRDTLKELRDELDILIDAITCDLKR